MRTVKGILFGLFIFIVTAVSIRGVVLAQSSDNLELNGYVVQGAFYQYYKQFEEPMRLLGYPISNEFKDPQTGVPVQFFQRAALRYVKGQVQPMPLGKDLQEPLQKNEGATPANFEAASCRTFSNGFTVCYSLLEFYLKYQSFLGNPISDAEVTDDRRFLQYFENGRLEWRAEITSGERVFVSDLGRIYYDLHPEYLAAITESNITSTGSSAKVTRLQTYAFVTQPVLAANGQQTLSILVMDQNSLPVKGVSIGVIVYPPSGQESFYRPPDTNEHGISQFDFSVSNVPLKEVVRVEVHTSLRVDTGEITGQTNTWFRVWW